MVVVTRLHVMYWHYDRHLLHIVSFNLRILCDKPYFSILQMTQPQVRKLKWPAQSHMTSKRQRQKWNSDLPTSKALQVPNRCANPS